MFILFENNSRQMLSWTERFSLFWQRIQCQYEWRCLYMYVWIQKRNIVSEFTAWLNHLMHTEMSLCKIASKSYTSSLSKKRINKFINKYYFQIYNSQMNVVWLIRLRFLAVMTLNTVICRKKIKWERTFSAFVYRLSDLEWINYISWNIQFLRIGCTQSLVLFYFIFFRLS